jgi:GT2 family glycosyltransferase
MPMAADDTNRELRRLQRLADMQARENDRLRQAIEVAKSDGVGEHHQHDDFIPSYAALELLTELEKVYSSRSWKVTFPLRYLAALAARKRPYNPFEGLAITTAGNDATSGQHQEQLTATVIVPVYGRVDALKRLWPSLIRECRAQEAHVIVVDDYYDTKTRELIEAVCSGPGVEIIQNSKNLGFRESVNLAFSTTSTDLVILANSDTELPADWLQRMMQPFEFDRVALSTSLAVESGANLTPDLPDAMSWREADAILKSIPPGYPSACTAIGYLMAIRRAAIQGSELFHSGYRDGYGEDSDLHYRVREDGWESVVVDNMCIYHESGGSYESKDSSVDLKFQNRALFAKRWGKAHAKAEEEWTTRELPLMTKRTYLALNGSAALANLAHRDVVMVLPTTNQAIGGVRVALDVASHLTAGGVSVAVVSQDGSRGRYANGMRIMHPDAARQKLRSARVVIATGVGTMPCAVSLANDLRCLFGVFLQGPEMYFDAGTHSNVFEQSMLRADFVVTVSPYLSRLARSYGAVHVTEVAYGPDPDLYYETLGLRPRQVAVPIQKGDAKGSWLALPIARRLATRGWNVVGFGNGDDLLVDLPNTTMRGFLKGPQLARLFQESRFVLDFSLFEGLGLVPLEAAFCGAIPVLTEKGATVEVMTTPTPGVVIIENPLDIDEIVSRLDSMSDEECGRRQEALRALSISRNRHTGLNEAVSSIQEAIATLPSRSMRSHLAVQGVDSLASGSVSSQSGR